MKKSKKMTAGLVLCVVISCLGMMVLSLVNNCYAHIETGTTAILRYNSHSEYAEIVSSNRKPETMPLGSMPTVTLNDTRDAYRFWLLWDIDAKPSNVSYETELGTLYVSKGGMVMLMDQHFVASARIWVDEAHEGRYFPDGKDELTGYVSTFSCQDKWWYSTGWMVALILFGLTGTGLSLLNVVAMINIIVLLVMIIPLVYLLVLIRREEKALKMKATTI